MAAMKSAEQMFGREFEERTEFDRRKKRDEDQQAAPPKHSASRSKSSSGGKTSWLRSARTILDFANCSPNSAAYMNQERSQQEEQLVMQEERARERSLDEAMERDRQMALAEMAQKMLRGR